MGYTVTNGIHIVSIPVKDFKIIMYDEKKKSMGKNRCNAGYFGTYHENNKAFTLPSGHVVCDYAATNTYTKKYCTERGKFKNNKFMFDSSTFSYMNSFYGKALSTFIVKNGKAYIDDIKTLPTDLDYAIAGIPIMRDGKDVKFNTYVKAQGWDASPLYGTWHVFIGIKNKMDTNVYIMGMKTTSSNMILKAEAYNKFASLGFYDVIKLDGGGSFYFNVNNKVTSTSENRRVCTIIDFNESKTVSTTPIQTTTQSTSSTNVKNNPYTIPIRTLKFGSYGNDVKWLQFELNRHGSNIIIDGDFGAKTEVALKLYQSKNNLTKDGRCGPQTRLSLSK